MNATDRFWEKVDKSGECWLWTGAVKDSGYGVFSHEGRRVDQAHRASWEFANGPVPAGLDVCHACDNRRCVRPDHLFTGTRAENMADAVAKGRTARGARHGRARLTEVEVREIRRLRASGVVGRSVAERFEVSEGTVTSIDRGQSWAWLP